MIDDLLALLHSWVDRGAVVDYDDEQVAAPHTVIAAFDAAGFDDDVARLTAGAEHLQRLGDRLGGVCADLPEVWSGPGGVSAATAAGRLHEELAAAADQLTVQARTAATAAAVLGEVLGEYRTVMAAAAAPLAVGTSPQAAGDELSARLDAARAAGLATERAVRESLDVLADQWRTAGELILAGGR
ncbi:hypothetical protein [Gordonia sp. VNK21]|uniref:hypothetical protein n=1 Tax=Gordonia sp. VNK21 TaxID=3382483 RepID=UPI0038D41B51